MGMSTYVLGFREPDEEWKKMKEVYDVCVKNKIEPPKEVHEFFNWEPPKDEGIEVDMSKMCEHYSPHECAEGYKIKISDLPKHITYICFVNSY